MYAHRHQLCTSSYSVPGHLLGSAKRSGKAEPEGGGQRPQQAVKPTTTNSTTHLAGEESGCRNLKVCSMGRDHESKSEDFVYARDLAFLM